SESFSLAEVVHDYFRHVVKCGEDIAEPVKFQKVNDMLQHGAVHHRHHGLRPVTCKRSKPCPFSACHHYRLQRNPASFSLRCLVDSVSLARVAVALTSRCCAQSIGNTRENTRAGQPPAPERSTSA